MRTGYLPARLPKLVPPGRRRCRCRPESFSLHPEEIATGSGGRLNSFSAGGMTSFSNEVAQTIFYEGGISSMRRPSLRDALADVSEFRQSPVRKSSPFLLTASTACFIALFVAILGKLFTLRKLRAQKGVKAADGPRLSGYPEQARCRFARTSAG